LRDGQLVGRERQLIRLRDALLATQLGGYSHFGSVDYPNVTRYRPASLLPKAGGRGTTYLPDGNGPTAVAVPRRECGLGGALQGPARFSGEVRAAFAGGLQAR
jgi:hypothetical protein